jgi:hypothetical protein
MSVYVDDMQASFKYMKMCHMIADTSDELIAMADRIDLPRVWIQNAGTYREHFDICKSKRVLAVRYGAIEITMIELGRKLHAKRKQLV